MRKGPSAHLPGLPNGLPGHSHNQAVALGICRADDDGGLGLVVLPQRIDVPQEHAQLHQRQRVPQDGLQGKSDAISALNAYDIDSTYGCSPGRLYLS